MSESLCVRKGGSPARYGLPPFLSSGIFHAGCVVCRVPLCGPAAVKTDRRPVSAMESDRLLHFC